MSKRTVRLLIVDDDVVDGECLVRYINKRDLECETHIVCDGAEALEFLRQETPEGPRDRTIVVLDVNMPGVNGHEFLDELRSDSALHSTVVFMFTSSTHERDITQAYDRNVAGYFSKSNLDGLLDTIVPYSKNVEFPIARSA